MTTKETIIDIYNKAKRIGIASASMSKDDFYRITIYEDGSLSADFEHYCCGDIDTEEIEISSEELDMDWEELAVKREKEKKEKREQEIKRIEDQREKDRIQKEERERQQYIELKKKFQNE